MRNGLKRHRIRLEGRSDTPDANGLVSGAWLEIVTVWAQKLPARARELQQGGRDVTEAVTLYVTGFIDIGSWLSANQSWDSDFSWAHPFQEHNQSTISERMRLVDGPEVYNILSVQNRGGRNRQIEILCQKAV